MTNFDSENMRARRAVYDAAVSELYAINPDIDPVAQFDEAFAAFRVAAQARALKPDRDDLLEILKEMISMENLNILLTSRREKDIAEQLEPVVDVIIDLKDGGLDSDIALYVQKRLAEDRKLRRWDPDTKQMIQKALLDSASGM